MDTTYSIHGRIKINLKQRDQFDDLDIDSMIIQGDPKKGKILKKKKK
jgi:hypothetical protein